MAHRIVLIDDHALFRQGLRALFSARSDFTIVAEVGDSRTAHAEILNHLPDIVLMEIALAGGSGLALAESIRRRMPGTRVIVLTTQASGESLREALRVGVHGYLLKDASFDELALALRCALEGKCYISASLSGQMVDGFLHPERNTHGHSPLNVLTHRERRILQLVAEGRSNRLAAEMLSVSPKTVEKHRANLMRKLGLRNVSELMMVAVDMGLVERPGTVSRLVAARVA